MELLIVTGLSGSGKSSVMKFLEDIGYYCIDNMPPALIDSFIMLDEQKKINLKKAAFVMDIRGGVFFDELQRVLGELKQKELTEGRKPCKILFLEASDETLLKRFKETRRIHPLNNGTTDSEAIKMERQLLEKIRENADYVVDTTNLKTADLHSRLSRMLSDDAGPSELSITVQSFGYKYGMPLDTDIVWDVRFIPNPYYIDSMKNLTGNDREVQEYCMGFEETVFFLSHVIEMVEKLIPYYIKQGKRHLMIAFGCTGGQHRSTSMANEFSRVLSEKGYSINTVHRDINKR